MDHHGPQELNVWLRSAAYHCEQDVHATHLRQLLKAQCAPEVVSLAEPDVVHLEDEEDVGA